MKDTPKSSTRRRWTIILIGLFMVFLWLPSLDTFFHVDRTLARSENRNLATFPKLPAKPQAYVQGLEAYFNDHFGFRKFLVRKFNRLRWSLFKEKNSYVLEGKDGWLYYTVGEAVDHYSGLLQFTPEQLHDWQVLLEARRDWLAKRGISFLFVVAPDKHSIYPEYLPSWAVKVRPQTKLDQFVAYMHEHSTVPILDLREVVVNAKQTRPTFLKIDAHWNLFGAFVAYQEIMRALAREHPGLDAPLPLADFTVTNELKMGGDLARFIGVNMTESNYFNFTAKPELPRFSTELSPPEHPQTPKFTKNPSAKGRVIVFQDSFALGWIPFFGYHFNQVTYLWQYNLDPAWIEREKPDLVIMEMNERFFNTEHPKSLLAKEALK